MLARRAGKFSVRKLTSQGQTRAGLESWVCRTYDLCPHGKRLPIAAKLSEGLPSRYAWRRCRGSSAVFLPHLPTCSRGAIISAPTVVDGLSEAASVGAGEASIPFVHPSLHDESARADCS